MKKRVQMVGGMVNHLHNAVYAHQMPSIKQGLLPYARVPIPAKSETPVWQSDSVAKANSTIWLLLFTNFKVHMN